MVLSIILDLVEKEISYGVTRMYMIDVIKKNLIFSFPKSVREETVRLVIYNEKESFFPLIATFSSRQDTIKISIKNFSPHWQYKYKYQVKKENEWKTIIPYKYINVNFEDENAVRYKFFRETESDKLLICFSGNGQKPAYNYIGAFSSLKVNRLFILDDFTTKTSNNSVFYVGTNRQNEVMKKIHSLVKKISEEIIVNKNNIICCGTL